MKILPYFVLLEATLATTIIYFKNYCNYTIPVVKTRFLSIGHSNEKFVFAVPTNGVKLTAFPGGRINFRAGLNGKTAAEFSLNDNGLDFYGINITEGFDVGMTIEPYNGPAIVCYARNCPDGFMTKEGSQAKMHSMRAKSEFSVIFCRPKKHPNIRKKHTAIYFHNNCRENITVVRKYKKHTPMIVHELRSGFYWIIKERIQGSFTAGFHGSTKVALSLDQNGTDYYSINVENGFDKAMSVGYEGGEVIACTQEDCPKSVEKKRSHLTGGRMHIVWCPIV